MADAVLKAERFLVVGQCVTILPPDRLDAGHSLVRLASPGKHLLEPFLNEAVIFNTNELEAAPRVVATQEGRVLLSRGDTAYVRGEVGQTRDWRVFRNAKPLVAGGRSKPTRGTAGPDVPAAPVPFERRRS